MQRFFEVSLKPSFMIVYLSLYVLFLRAGLWEARLFCLSEEYA